MSQECLSRKDRFKLILAKTYWLSNKLYYRITKQHQKYYNHNVNLQHPITIKSRYGLLVVVDDTFKLRAFTGSFSEQGIIDKLCLSANSNFIDVGANIGVYTLYAASKVKEGKIIAIEASRRHCEDSLLKNIHLNNLKNVICLNAAIWNKDNDEIRLYDDTISGYNPTCFGGEGMRYDVVKTRTLDSIVAEHNLQGVDCIKIDIEGAEVQALQGAKRSLEITKNLIVEVHGKDKGVQCEQILTDSRFKVNKIRKKHGDDLYWILATKN